MKRPIGVAALTCIELAPQELVPAAAAAGYDCVGLRLIPVANQVLPPFDLRETERRLADTGIGVLDVEVFRLAPGTQVADFEAVMATAARLRAAELLVHGADPDEARLVETFGRLCELAARYGLTANLEPMPWVEVSDVARALRVISGAQRDNAALLVDPIHFFRADNSLEALAKVPRQRLRYLQFCDAHPGRPTEVQELIRQARSDRLFPGEGALDLAGLLAALPPDLPISLEIPHAGGLDARERVRRALAAARKFV